MIVSQKAVFVVVGSIFSFLFAYSQETNEKWSLEACIAHALNHNVQIRQQEIIIEQTEIQLHTTKFSRLPGLTAGIGQNWGWGRSNNTETGIYENRTISATNFYLSGSIPVFTGFEYKHKVQRAIAEQKASQQNLENKKEELSLLISSLYIQILLDKEMYKIGEQQMELTFKNIEQTRLLVEVGKVNSSQLDYIKSLYAQEKLAVLEAGNQLKISLFELAQLLEITDTESFDIADPSINIEAEETNYPVFPADMIYQQALMKPIIREQEFLLISREKSIAVARSAYLPRLNMSFSYNNSYFYNYNSDNNISFSEQLRQYGGRTIYLDLSIPIFNRFQVKNQVKTARLDQQLQMFALEHIRKELRKEIEIAHIKAMNAKEKLSVACQARNHAGIAYQNAEQKYKAGKVPLYELNEIKVQWSKTLSEEVMAKYDYLFSCKILNFYQGKHFTNLVTD